MARKSRKNMMLLEATALPDKEKKVLFKAGLYARLSHETEENIERGTIETQMELMKNYVKDHEDIVIEEEYYDASFTGTNFERPDFKRMLEDAKRGRINCIIVKDLSRLGRNYVEMGNYIERVFPFLNVRFIAVTDDFDSFRPGTDIMMPLKNIVNEFYAKDISKKVSTAHRRKWTTDEYMCGFAPYGYLKSKTEKNRIVVDEATAGNVRLSKISMFMHGAGDGNIIFGDGLENYPDKEIIPKSFDILVANPPYSVKAFKPHLKLSNNQLDILEKISNDGSEIETLFVERISQLLKPNGVAAVVLPSSILNKENESFISARESLLKNFNIIAIATLGSKTFGATGTNTVILFLQKFNEPPKRTDMVLDSVEAILSKADIDGWEDESILRGYLKKIGVKKDTYDKLLSKSKDYTHWKDDNYFGQHYDEFVTSTEYVKKSKQKTFLKLSDAEQKKWFNQKFYEYVFSIEQEKLFYYSLVYNQDTLIISAPDENKEQEKFLGYKWSNRKGQEGIQIIKAGGCLYNSSDRSDNNSIAGLIRNAFSDEDEFDVEDLSDYYYRLRLQDMLDFSGTTFNKSIKTTPTRVLKDIPGLTNYRLADKNFFDLSIGNRVLSDEVVENGSIPIYSANVFEEFGRIDKQNITDFSVPSILWGIDGDWMVNIMPADKPFYPTDHCGVLRIKTDDILPKYMALALQVEGEFERFSRSNRASTQRIANLIIQVPSVSEQQKLVDEIEAIDKRIADEQAIISEQSAKVKSKFVEMFGDNPATTHGKNSVKLSTLCENLDNERKPITEHLRNKGDIPYYGASGIVDYVAEYIFDETLLLISEDGANLVSRNMPIAFSITGKSWVNNHVHILRFKNYKLQKYVESYINNIDLSEYINKNANPKLTQEKLNSIMIYMPNDTTLDLYISSINQCDKLKFEAQERLEELNAAREDIIDKYFR